MYSCAYKKYDTLTNPEEAVDLAGSIASEAFVDAVF